MTAFNIVRFRVKPGKQEAFERVHRDGHLDAAGFQGGHLVKTGERSYCVIGQWASTDALVAARPAMIGILNQFRGMLEDLGGGLGVTDPVSGESVVDLPWGR